MNDKQEDYPDFVDEKLFKRSQKEALQIEWSPLWEKRSDDNKIEYLKKLSSSYNHACVLLQKEKDILNAECFNLKAELDVCLLKSTQSQVFIRNQLNRENKTQQKLLQENIRLRDDIKDLERQIKELKGE